MSLWKIAWRSIQQRALASSLTALSMALGVSLVVTVWVVHGAVEDTFGRTAQGYDLIIGAKGSRLQLVLNTVFHLDRPIENIPWTYYKEFVKEDGKFTKNVEVAIPFCLGDNYKGYRVVGTTPDMFDRLEYANGQKYEFADGENFKTDDYFTAVIGYRVAQDTGLKVGDSFQPTHGVSEDGHQHDPFKVVGILAPTGTANDRALFINIEGFFLLEGHAKPVAKQAGASTDDEHAGEHEHDADHAHDESHQHERPGEDDDAHDHEDAHENEDADSHDHEDGHDADGHDHDSDETGDHGDDHDADSHDHEAAHSDEDHHEHADHGHDEHEGHVHDEHHHHHHEPLPEEQREVTAILIKSQGLYGGFMSNSINEGNIAQAVSPTREVTELFEQVIGNITAILLFLAVLIVVVAGIGIMVSMYNSMSERFREIAIMRALGAGRGTVMAVVLLESILLSACGGLAGLLLGHGLISALSGQITAYTGVSIGFLQFERIELLLIPGLAVLATLVGFLPAFSAYRTDVAKALSDHP